jgi:hypothetical protein
MAAVQQTRQEQQQHQEQQQEQQDQLELQSLLLLPNDVWERVLTITDPKDICSLGCSSMHNSHLAGSKRRGVLLARHCGRLQLRVVRQCMRARSTFVSNTCSRQQLDSREASQAQILATLQVCLEACRFGLRARSYCAYSFNTCSCAQHKPSSTSLGVLLHICSCAELVPLLAC